MRPCFGMIGPVTRRTNDTGAIVMAVYRPRPDLLARQLQSLRHQTLTDWHCLVGIDGPDSATRELLDGLVADDPRFTVVEYPDNVGVYRHFERLLVEVDARADWIALSDQDDYWHPRKLARLVGELSRDGVTAATCQARIVSDDGTVYGTTARLPGDLVDTLLRNQVTGGFSVFRPEVVRRALPFPRGTAVAIHDHWLAVVASAMGRVSYDDAVLMDYVQHGANAIGEDSPTPWRKLIISAVSAGGLRAFTDDFALQVWGWPVSMGQALLERFPDHPERRTLLALSEGKFSPGLQRHVLSNIVRRRLRGRAVVGLGAAAVRFRRTQRARGAQAS